MERCFYCERAFGFPIYGSYKPLQRTKDHVMPRCKGGKSDASNIVLACKHCNILKRDLTLPEFEALLQGMANGERTISKKHSPQNIATMIKNVNALRNKIAWREYQTKINWY